MSPCLPDRFMTVCILCTAGLSPDLQSTEQFRQIMWPTDIPDQGEKGTELGTTCVYECEYAHACVCVCACVCVTLEQEC